MLDRGDSLASVHTITGALIPKEAVHFISMGMSSVALRHGPIEIIDEPIAVWVYEGHPAVRNLNERLVNDIQAMGGRATLIRCTRDPHPLAIPPAPDLVRPLLGILSAQLLSLALAELGGLGSLSTRLRLPA